MCVYEFLELEHHITKLTKLDKNKKLVSNTAWIHFLFGLQRVQFMVEVNFSSSLTPPPSSAKQSS